MPGDKTTTGRGERAPVVRLLPTAGSDRDGDGDGAVMGGEEAGEVAHAGDESRGLSPNQRRFLALRVLHASDKDCAAVVGVHPNTVSLWRQMPEFLTAYDGIWRDGLEEWAKQERRRLLGKALAAAEDLLEATAPVRAKEGLVLDASGNPVLVADNLARARGIEIVARMNGLWAPEAAADAGNPVAIEAMRLMAQLVERRERVERETGAGGAIEGEIVP